MEPSSSRDESRHLHAGRNPDQGPIHGREPLWSDGARGADAMTATRRRHIATAACLLSLMGLVAPAHGRIRVETSRSPGFELGAYETFGWDDETARPATDLLAPGSELDRLFKEIVGARLEKAGLRRATPEEAPELSVEWTVYAEDVLAGEERYDQYEHWAAPVDPVGLSGTRGVVIVDLRDAATGKVVWSGRARSSARTPEELLKKARRMLEKAVASLQ